ncbi:hypothetical protein CCP3SC15_360014 [Gammaproteobacteria bacterium]
MREGHIKLFRKLRKAPYYQDSQYVHLWIHLLMSVNWTEKRLKISDSDKFVDILPGQILTSRKALSKETGIQESKIERILKALKNEQQIEQQTFTKYRIISIINWREYQYREQQIEPQVNSRRTTDEHKEERKERKEQDKPQTVIKTTDENRVEVSIRKSVEEKRQFIRDRFHFTDNEIEIEVEEIILKCQKRSPGPDVWLFISRWFKNRRDEINVREKARTGKTGTQSHIGTNNVGNGTSGAFEEEFVDRSHLWNL